MRELAVFNNEEFGSIRTLQINEEVWFIGKDVAEILGYTNSRKAIGDHIDSEDKKDGVTIRDSIGRDQQPTLINESGLYSLILSSKLPTARKFKHWVTSEVLPSIRKTGQYGAVKKPRKEKLSSVNNAVQTMTKLAEKAGMKPEFQFYMAKQLYEQNGVSFPSIDVVQPEALLDLTMMARRLGILSTKGIPHAQAVGAIVADLALNDEEKVLTSFEKNGHVGTTVQYRASVLPRVELWLSERGYPPMIALKGKSY